MNYFTIINLFVNIINTAVSSSIRDNVRFIL